MKPDPLQAHGLTHTTLSLLFLAMLIGASFWILQVFLSSVVWATMIVVATWPLMQWTQAKLLGKRALATTVMTLVLLLLFFLPILFAVLALVERSEEIVLWIQSLSMYTLAPPPDWVGSLPVVGRKIVAKWQHLIAIGPAGVSAMLAPYAGKALGWLASMSGSFGLMVIHFLMTVLVSAIFYQCGDRAADWLSLFARRIAGHYGETALILAGKAIRAVALGVVGTALIQSLLGGVSLLICGIPAAGILTAVMFILCLAQLGPVLVLLPAVVWLFYTNQTLWGGILAVITVFLCTIDNVIRPLLMKKGADLPVLLIFAGVAGGMIVFGVIGLFIGPVVLAIAYTLLDAWVTGDVQPEDLLVSEEDLITPDNGQAES